jgi:hypothetical protein
VATRPQDGDRVPAGQQLLGEADADAEQQDEDDERGVERVVVGGREAQQIEAEHDQRREPHPPASADRL